MPGTRSVIIPWPQNQGLTFEDSEAGEDVQAGRAFNARRRHGRGRVFGRSVANSARDTSFIIPMEPQTGAQTGAPPRCRRARCSADPRKSMVSQTRPRHPGRARAKKK